MIDTNETAVFVFVDLNLKRMLLEKRGPRQSFANKIIFPGGSQKTDETLEQTLLRETEREEIGVKVVKFEKLVSDGQISGETGRNLHIFAITEWAGEIPERVLDKGNELLWVDFDHLRQIIKVKSSRRIALLVLQKYK